MINLIKSLVYSNKSIRCVVEKNQYVFDVDKKLKKPEIKKICQEIFNTKVISVNTYILPPKKRRPNYKRIFVRFNAQQNPFDNFKIK